MVVGLVAMLVFGGYASFSKLAIETGYVQYHGHLQIQRTGYFVYGSGNPVEYGIADYQRIIDVVKQDPVLRPMLVVVTPSLRLNGVAGNFAQGSSQGVVALGSVEDEQNRMHRWDDYGCAIYSPEAALSGTPSDSTVIGTGVARMLQLCEPLKLDNCPTAEEMGMVRPPDNHAPAISADIQELSSLEQQQTPESSATRIELLAANQRGAPNVVSLNVVQAQNWGVKEIDDSLIVLHLEQAQRLVYGAGPAQVTAIQIQLAHTAQIPAARARLQQILSDQFKDAHLQIVDYEELAPIYKQTVQFFDSIFGFISILIYVIVLFTVGNTMSMAVAERSAEIGTLRAIGQQRNGIRSLFICEGGMLGVIGAVLGIAIALPVGYLINHSGLTWTPPAYSYAYPVAVRIWGDHGLIFSSAISLVVVAVIAAWWPANRAARQNIVDALRHV